MRSFYLRHILRPLFADFAVEYVHQVDRLIHGKMMQQDWIGKARGTPEKEL